MGLLDTELAKWKRAFGLISGIPKTMKNNPANAATADAMFGLLGGVPGLGDYVSGAEAKYRYDQGDMLGAGLAGLGALPAVPNVAGMFIGKGAKTWDALKAAEAEKLLAKGVDPKEVWKQTGTFKGVDNALRQEIPDNQAFYRGSNAAGSSFVNDVLLHPTLYDTYPNLKNYRVIESPHQGGSFDDMTGRITVGPTDSNSLALHELQHAIQQREGFARGGSPDEFRFISTDEIDFTKIAPVMEKHKVSGDDTGLGAVEFLDYVKKEIYKNGGSDKDVSQVNKELLRIRNKKSPEMQYRRLAGEAEARATQARMNMDMPQRLDNYPLDSYDVPLDQLIVRGLLGEDVGPQMATVYHGSPHKFNKFDMSKIGTGEGAQAYGHGLYFAESPDVAVRYRDTLTNFRPDHIEASLVERGVPAELANTYAQYTVNTKGGARAFDDFSKEINQTSPSPYIEAFRQRQREALPKLQSELDAINGSLYKVDIPDEAIPRMLDWDKPLSEQAPEVQAASKKVLTNLYGNGKPLKDSTMEYLLKTKTGQNLVGDSKAIHGQGVEMFNSTLLDNGIPGIRYLDGSSRTAGDGTSNFVLFDDQMPRILEVNGQPTGLLSYADEAKKAKKK